MGNQCNATDQDNMTKTVQNTTIKLDIVTSEKVDMDPKLKESIQISLENKESSSTDQDSDKKENPEPSHNYSSNLLFNTIIRKDIDQLTGSILDSINERDDLEDMDSEMFKTNSNTNLNCTFKHTRMDDYYQITFTPEPKVLQIYFKVNHLDTLFRVNYPIPQDLSENGDDLDLIYVYNLLQEQNADWDDLSLQMDTKEVNNMKMYGFKVLEDDGSVVPGYDGYWYVSVNGKCKSISKALNDGLRVKSSDFVVIFCE